MNTPDQNNPHNAMIAAAGQLGLVQARFAEGVTQEKETRELSMTSYHSTVNAYIITPEMTAAAERYFNVWSKQRDAMRKQFIRAGRKRFPNDHTFTEHLASAVLFAPNLLIALPEEATTIAAMSNDEIRNQIPPVFVSFSASANATDQYLTRENTLVTIIGNHDSYRVVDLCSDDSKVLSALDSLCEYRKDQSNFVGLSQRETRALLIKKSRTFSCVFWDWYEKERRQNEIKEPRIVVDPITGEFVISYSGFVEQAVLSSIPNAKGAQPILGSCSTRGLAFHRHEQKQGIVDISFVAEDALKKLQEVDDYTSDSILIHFDQWRHNRDEAGYAWMTSEAMLKSRGIKPKTKKEGSIAYSSGYRPDDYLEAYRRVQQIEDFWITVQSKDVWEKTKKGNVRKKRQDITEGRLISIILRKRLAGPDGDPGEVYAWKFRLFDGLHELVDDDCFAYVSTKILGYDHYRQIPEKRIGLYSAVHFKMNHMRSMSRKVGTIIEACRLSFNEKRPQEFINRFHKALNLLVKDGVFSNWNYLISGKVEDGKLIDARLTKNLEDLDLRPRGFWEAYLQKTLWLEPNPNIPKTKRKGDIPTSVVLSPQPPNLSA